MSLDRHQLQVLQIAMSLPEAASLALAGGGAMLAHGLVERRTADLDLFTPVAAAIAPAAQALQAALTDRGYQVTVTRAEATYVQLQVTGPEGTTHVELAQDARQHDPVMVAGARVLAPDDVAASKTLALFGRAAARDLVDVDALTRRYSPGQLLALAAESDAGFDMARFRESLVAAARRPAGAFVEVDVDGEELVRLRRWATIWAAQLSDSSGEARWSPVLEAVDPRLPGDPEAAVLATALGRMEAADVNVAGLLVDSTRVPLPAERPGRALHYRLLERSDTGLTEPPPASSPSPRPPPPDAPVTSAPPRPRPR